MKGVRTGGGLTALQIAVGICGAAHAAPIVDELAKCAALSVDASRLACYDALSASLRSQATARGGSLPASTLEAGTPTGSHDGPGRGKPVDDESRFGLNKPSIPAEPRGSTSVTSTVKKIDSDQNQNTYVLLENGQTWAFNDGSAVLRVGDSVTIKKAALGSFLMSTPTKRTHRVRRIS